MTETNRLPSRPLGRTRLEAVLQAYLAERADDTQAFTSMLALLTTTIGLITLIGFALINRSSVPAWLIALAPILPIPFIAFGALVTQIAQIRGRVIDDYEREIRELVRAEDGEAGTLIPYGHTILNRQVWEASYARIVIALSFVIFFTGYTVVIIECFRYSKGSEFALALASLVVSTVSTAILIGLFIATLFPYHWLARGVAELEADERKDLKQQRHPPEQA